MSSGGMRQEHKGCRFRDPKRDMLVGKKAMHRHNVIITVTNISMGNAAVVISEDINLDFGRHSKYMFRRPI